MDNHLAAYWCWEQHISNQGKYSLFHVDAHWDLVNPTAHWLNKVPCPSKLSLQDYITHEDPYSNATRPWTSPERFPAHRWDNYFAPFIIRRENLLESLYFCVHQDTERNLDDYNVHYEIISKRTLPSSFRNAFDSKWASDKWIINIDLDYFFYTPDCDSSNYEIMFSDNYLNSFFETLRQTIKLPEVSVITIALSPACCGGWDNAMDLCLRICDIIGLEFSPP